MANPKGGKSKAVKKNQSGKSNNKGPKKGKG